MLGTTDSVACVSDWVFYVSLLLVSLALGIFTNVACAQLSHNHMPTLHVAPAHIPHVMPVSVLECGLP